MTIHRKTIRSLRVTPLLATAGLMGLLATPAWAQQKAPGAAGASSDPDSGEIIVTANRKFGAEADRAPVAVSSVSAEDIARLNIRTVQDITVRVPGLVYTSFANYGIAYIRGLGSNYSNGGLESPVAVYVDGVYQERQAGSVLDLVDLQGVQVLKGPQGTLYGRNATGGAILVQTADPTNKFEGFVNAELGNLHQNRVQAVVNVPLGDSLALRISGQSAHLGNWVHGQFTGNKRGKTDTDYIRAKLRWSPTDEFTATYTLAYNQFKTTASNQRPTQGAPVCQVCATDGFVPNFDDFYSYTNSENQYNKNSYVNNTLDLTYDGEKISVQSITGLNFTKTITLADQENLPPNIFDFYIRQKGPTFTNDSYMRTHLDGPLNFLLGFSAMRERNKQFVVLSGSQFGGVDVPNFNKVKIDSVSVYGEASYEFGGGFKATGGARYNIDRKEILIGSDPSSSVYSGGVKETFRNLTPRAVLSYENDSGFYYISYNRGARSGGFNSPLFAPADAVRPETLDSFEVGLKNKFLNGALSTNLVGFYGNYKNIQVQLVDTKGTGGVLLRNAASGKVSGIEFEASLAATHNLRLSGGVTYLHNKFKDYPDAPTYLPNAPGVPGLASGVVDLSNTRFANSPKFAGFIGGDLTFDLPADWSFRLNSTARFTTNYDFTIAAGSPVYRNDRQRGYTKVDASLAFITPDKMTDIGLYGNNLFGVHYAEFRNTAGYGTFISPALPRTYGVRVSRKF